ncbi:hypothetical protein NDU88_006696 [Pleurodeles waltl]|uniref:Uncharacterized protein n=1 Tax=Pleurodeles waltl TaxID=8319 RepID=A0AAV7LQC8_PLEWA|nr:hypothetical protein NDU88_006696 [Pleurodeles waltl]
MLQKTERRGAWSKSGQTEVRPGSRARAVVGGSAYPLEPRADSGCLVPIGLYAEVLRSDLGWGGVERAMCGREEVLCTASGWSAAHIGPRHPNGTVPGGPQLGALPRGGRRTHDPR